MHLPQARRSLANATTTMTFQGTHLLVAAGERRWS